MKFVSKKKVNDENILHEIIRSSATNLEKDTLQIKIDQMIIQAIIHKNYKISNII